MQIGPACRFFVTSLRKWRLNGSRFSEDSRWCFAASKRTAKREEGSAHPVPFSSRRKQSKTPFGDPNYISDHNLGILVIPKFQTSPCSKMLDSGPELGIHRWRAQTLQGQPSTFLPKMMAGNSNRWLDSGDSTCSHPTSIKSSLKWIDPVVY